MLSHCLSPSLVSEEVPEENVLPACDFFGHNHHCDNHYSCDCEEIKLFFFPSTTFEIFRLFFSCCTSDNIPSIGKLMLILSCLEKNYKANKSKRKKIM